MSVHLRVLIVDDEPGARDFLRKRLAEHPDIEVVAEAISVATALVFCGSLHPDVIFLDIKMPHAEGTELLTLLPADPRPEIVFVTAHDDRAVEAFELHALDYLLKPFSAKRMAATVNKLQRHFAGRLASKATGQNSSAGAPLGTIWVHAEKEMLQVELAEIALIESEDSYSRSLPASDFFRIDRFRIINLRQVQHFERVSRDKAFIQLLGVKAPKELRRQSTLRLAQRLKDRVIN
ncbi:MAG: response regulator [Opitutaceae bacterium]|nr:response regulator [Opitutaceae bacterium]